VFQALTFSIHFYYHISHSRKVLLLQGFDFANPENSNFKKNPYLECVQIGIFARFNRGEFALLIELDYLFPNESTP